MAGVKRKRHVKKRLGVADHEKKQEAKREGEYTEKSRALKVARKELRVQKERRKHAPTPIAKRKPLGHGAIGGGMRASIDAEKEKRRAKREKRLAKEAKEAELVATGKLAKKNKRDGELSDISKLIAQMGGKQG
eukprot:gene420-348_t